MGRGAEHFVDAITLNARIGARPWLAHAQDDYARMLLERANPETDSAQSSCAPRLRRATASSVMGQTRHDGRVTRA
jgi:hypothetical protein